MYRVLIADDEPFILEGLRYVINWEEYGLDIVDEAHNGQDALELLKTLKVNILITDIKMPKLSGLELINQAKIINPNIKIIILSGYDDYYFLHEAIKLGIENYLLKPIKSEELSSTLLNIIDKIDRETAHQTAQYRDSDILKNNILCRIVSNTISENEILEKSSLLDLDFNSSNCIVCIISLLNINDKPVISLSANSICSELVAVQNQGVAFYDPDGNITIIFMKDGISLPEIYNTVHMCIKRINLILKIDVFASIGKIYHDFHFLSKSYGIAKSLLDYELVMPSNCIVEYDKIEKSTNEMKDNIIIDYQHINNLLLARDKKAVRNYVLNILEVTKRSDGISPSILQNLSIEILFNINNYVRSQIRNADCYFRKISFDYSSVFKINSYDELVIYLDNIIMKAIDVLCMGVERISPIIKLIRIYIQNNYQEDISLTQLSKRFNVNAAYLGQQFKKEIGELLSDYVNYIRIEKAKELLSNTCLKISEISDRVGYTEPNYFYRAFKKYTYNTPSDFRKSQMT